MPSELAGQFSEEQLATARAVMAALSALKPARKANTEPVPRTVIHQTAETPVGEKRKRLPIRNLFGEQILVQQEQHPNTNQAIALRSRPEPMVIEETREAPQRYASRRYTIQPANSPLCADILEEPMEKLKFPLCKYDGSTDPEVHCNTFEQHMMLYTDSDAMWCKIFPSTLLGVASGWYKGLPKGSVYNYRQLETEFMLRFISRQQRKKTSGELMAVTQRSGESLRDYLTRFNNESTSIPNLQQEIAVVALMRGMNHCEFKKYLGRKSFTDLGSALIKAHEYIKSDELMTIPNHYQSAQTRNAAPRPVQPAQQNQNRGFRKDEQRKDPRGRDYQKQSTSIYPTFHEYTPLNAPRAAIYNVNKNENWKRPPPMSDKPRPQSKYCAFHDDCGHYTENCRDLKDNIEDMIRRGYLTQYKARQNNNNQQNSNWQSNNTNNRLPSTQTPLRIEQKAPETSRNGEARNSGQKGPTVWVISGGPCHGGTISGAGRSLGEHRHLVNYHSTIKWPATQVMPNISFTPDDCRGIIYPHDDPLVLGLEIANFPVKRILVDGGSSANIIFWEAFVQLKIDEKELTRVNYPVIGFSGATVFPEGSIRLPVQIGEGRAARDLMVDFLVIKVPAAYNVIVGRPFIHDAQAVVSTYHLTMIYMSNFEKAERIRGSQDSARSCYLTALKTPGRLTPSRNIAREAATKRPAKGQAPRLGGESSLLPKKEKRQKMESPTIESIEKGTSLPRVEAGGRSEEVELVEGETGRTVKLGTDIDPQLRVNMIGLLREHADVFAFSADEMPGISSEVIEHRLNVDRAVRPVKQKKRNFSTEKNQAIQEEVEKLLAAGFIEPCDYPEWLANVVMVKKSNGSWRMCVDFTNLNRACPKDCYPLPRIDRLVDSTSGHALLSFLDAFSGYHQVSLAKADRKKAAFITEGGVFCYKAMPFGLKNAGATYQKLVDRVFANQKGRNIEVYVDDSIVKSKLETDHLDDLRETFETLRRYQMKLNPKKCVFGVKSGKFLGFLVSERGIDANPDKVEAILSLPQPKSIKDVQRLTGRMAALTRFVSKSADRSIPFFNTLKQNGKLRWGETEERAFEKVKEHLRALPTIARPEEGDKLQLYVSASAQTVAAVLISEKDKIQQPIYFVSHILNPAEARYSLIEKVAYAVLISARKLRPYFDAHTIQILTNFPLEKALQKMDTAGRLLRWAIELSEYDLEFHPRNAIKAQALADFVVEASYQEEETKAESWKVSVDGSAAQSGAGAGVVMISPTGDKFEYAIRFTFAASNNEAEYEAAIAGVQLCLLADAKRIVMTTDSQFVANQFSGEYETKEPSMRRYQEKLKTLTAKLEAFDIELVPRALNTAADSLAKLASSKTIELSRSVMIEIMHRRSTEEKGKEIMVITANKECKSGDGRVVGLEASKKGKHRTCTQDSHTPDYRNTSRRKTEEIADKKPIRRTDPSATRTTPKYKPGDCSAQSAGTHGHRRDKRSTPEIRVAALHHPTCKLPPVRGHSGGTNGEIEVPTLQVRRIHRSGGPLQHI
nr:uncharacterized protein LOC110799981 [Spinacia oleracea]